MRTTIRKGRLANGLSLLTEAMPDVRSVSIGVWLRRGSRNEPKKVIVVPGRLVNIVI